MPFVCTLNLWWTFWPSEVRSSWKLLFSASPSFVDVFLQLRARWRWNDQTNFDCRIVSKLNRQYILGERWLLSTSHPIYNVLPERHVAVRIEDAVEPRPTRNGGCGRGRRRLSPHGQQRRPLCWHLVHLLLILGVSFLITDCRSCQTVSNLFQPGFVFVHPSRLPLLVGQAWT